MGKRNRTKASNSIQFERKCTDWLAVIQLGIICLVAFLSPIIAGQLSALPSLVVESLVLIASILWLMRSMKKCSLGVLGGLPGALVLAFAGLILLSAVGSVSLHATMREVLRMFSYLLLFLMIADMRETRRDAALVLGCLLLSGLIVATIGVKEYLLAYRSAGTNWRVFSTFFNPDFFAGFLVLLLPVMLAWFLSSTSTSVSAISAVAGLFGMGALMLTGSRFGALAGLLGIIVTLAFAGMSGSLKKPQRFRLLIIIIPALLAAGVMAKPLIHKLVQRGVSTEMYSLHFRLYTWQGTARMAAANPIKGTGLGTFELAFPKYAKVAFTKLAHNSYLQIAGEAGPVAALVLAALLIILVFSGISTLVRRRIPESTERDRQGSFAWKPENALLVSGLLGGVVASMARNLVDSDWYITAIGISFWIVLGGLVAFTGRSERREVGVSPLSYTVAVSVLGLMAVLAFFNLAGAIYFADGEGRAEQGDAPGAIESYKQASAADPLDPDTHLNEASGYLAMAERLSDKSFAERAQEELECALRLERTSGKVYYRLAKVLSFEGKNDKAIAVLQEGLKYDPHSPQMMNSLALALEGENRHEEAIAIYRKMAEVEESPYEQIRAVPEFVEPLYIFARTALGRDLETKGDQAGAVGQYRKALDRINRYQQSVIDNRQILEVDNKRDPVLDNRIGAVTADLTTRMKVLGPGVLSH